VLKRTADQFSGAPRPNRSQAEPGLGVPDQEPGELLEWVGRATRTQGARVVGGRLLVTDRRLVFRPGLLDSMMGGQTWSLYFNEILEVVTDLHCPAPGSRFQAGWRQRLKVVARDGAAVHLAVAQLEDLVERLRRGRGW
jgi:hypothetical protein